MRTLALLLLALAGSVAHAQALQPLNIPPPNPLPESITLAVDKAESKLTYHVVHKLHKVDGKSSAVDGRAKLVASGAQVMIRVPVESFDSGNTNRDAHMKEAVEAEKHPLVEVRTLVDGFTLPTTFPTTIEKVCKVQLIFHGVTQTFDVPVKIVAESAKRLRASASLSLSLDAFKVERPQLMFVKVNDELKLDAELVFTR